MHGTLKEKGKQTHQRATTSTHSNCMSLLTSNLTKHSINEMKCLTVDDYFGKIIYRPMSEHFIEMRSQGKTSKYIPCYV